MFDALRRMIFPIIIIVLVFFAGMIVLQWGAGLSSRQNYASANLAAVINGEEISWQEYQRVYNNLYQSEVAQTQDELTDTKIREIQKTAWGQLLQDHLMTQQVAQRDIMVTDDDVYAYLRFSPPVYLQQSTFFQTDGKFDYQKYLNAMVDPQAANFWNSIEPAVRSDIAKLKLQEMVVQAAYVTEAEVRDAFYADQEKIKIGLVAVPHNKYRRDLPEAAEDELLDYYDQHKDAYFSEERAILDYVLIRDNPAEYDWDVARSQIHVVYDSIIAGADFAEMATNYSEDGTASEGGDLGWFKRGAMVAEFDSLAFSLKEDDISEPFRTQFGWHVIKHHGYRKDEAHVSHILVKVHTSQKTLDEIYEKLEAFRMAAPELGFQAAAEQAELSINRTNAFRRGQSTQTLGFDEALNKFAFAGEINDLTNVRTTSIGYYVAWISERMPAGIAAFEEVKDRVERNWRNDQLNRICRDSAQAVYDEIQKGTDIDRAARNFNLTYTTPGALTRNSSIAGVGSDPRAVGAVFALTEPGEISRPVDYNQGCAIFKLLDRPALDLADFNEKRDSISSTLLVTKQQDVLARWYDNLVARSEIVNNVDRVAARDTL